MAHLMIIHSTALGIHVCIYIYIYRYVYIYIRIYTRFRQIHLKKQNVLGHFLSFATVAAIRLAMLFVKSSCLSKKPIVI